MGKKKEKLKDASGSENLEDIEVAASSDDSMGMTKEGKFENERTDDTSDDDEVVKDPGTWPADCYSFIALHGPLENPKFFFFGCVVWMFQIVFLILLVLRVASVKLSTNEDTDNPDSGFLSSFIPSNVGTLSRATQYMALLSYCVFADESLKDVVTAVELWPKLRKVKEGDKVRLMMLSCFMRFAQGMLSTIVVLLMVVTTADVIDIILNFTAVNFISGFDDVAFELAQWGKYGPAMKAEADRIEGLPAPPCIFRKRQHVRYLWTILPVALALLIALTAVTYAQLSTNHWLTKRMRVQFEDDSNFEIFSGCYDYNINSTRNRFKDKRVVYDSYKANPTDAKFGYCQQSRKWYFYTGDSLDACAIRPENSLASSAQTYNFDIATSFEDGWVSQSGTPLELYFFSDEDQLSDEQCGSFLGDGICNTFFNIPDYKFDSGDCCSSTCDEIKCGIGTMQNAFDTDIPHGNGYPECKDPTMVPITIYLNDVYLDESFGGDDDDDGPFANATPKDPLMILDCDGNNVLMLSIDEAMANNTETVMVADGAICSLMVKNSTGALIDIWFVDYTIYHGDKKSTETDPIVIATGSSYVEEVIEFQRIRDCFFTLLNDYLDKTTIYTGTDPSNQAVDWLMEDSLGFSNCEFTNFVERYALATINFAAPFVVDAAERTDTNILWISKQRQCAWKSVLCVDGHVSELDLGQLDGFLLSGTIATEIGLLKNLTRLDMSDNLLFGTIPPEIGEWEKLDYISFGNNVLTGTIPSEIVQLTDLQWIFIEQNEMKGTIPAFFAEMPALLGIFLDTNSFTGTLPDEIGSMSNLRYFFLDENLLTGTLPSGYGDLQDLKNFGLPSNSITGTIPTELGRLKNLVILDLGYNELTGSIGEELLNMTLEAFDIYGNQLSDLIPVEGDEICYAEGGEHYCDCEHDCTFKQDWCGCEEAQSCCSSYLAQFDECIICGSSGVQNPNFYIDDIFATCLDIITVVRQSISDFGTTQACNEAKQFATMVGCLCLGEDTPTVSSNVEQCLICENSRLEDPDFSIAELNTTCGAAAQYVKTTPEEFNSTESCDEAKSRATQQGCLCVGEDPSADNTLAVAQLTECIVCENSGLQDPDFYIDVWLTSCAGAADVIKKSVAEYQTSESCEEIKSYITQLGCLCLGEDPIANTLDTPADSTNGPSSNSFEV